MEDLPHHYDRGCGRTLFFTTNCNDNPAFRAPILKEAKAEYAKLR